MLGWEYPPYGTGGLAPATEGVVSGLLANGVDVVLHLPVSHGIAGRAGLTVLGADARSADVPSAYELGTARDFFYKVRRYAVQARRAARGLTFDVVHAHDWLTALAASAIAADSGRPWVWHVHATEFDRAGEYGDARVVDVERRAAREADLIIAVSQYTRDLIIRRYGADPARVHVVHNSVDPIARAAPRLNGDREHRPLVLFLGRVTFQKGPDYFVEAARWVLSRRPDVLFVIAGDGDMRPRLMEHVAGLEMGASIVFAGLVTPDEAKRLFAMADVFVMPSVSEPFGLSALEAIRAGTPVIVSRGAGVSELARDVLEVDFWNVQQVADRIIAALEHAHLRETLTERSHASMERWSWTQAGDRIAGLYDLVRPGRRLMPAVCFYFQVHQPFRLRPFTIFDVGAGDHPAYFDDAKNAEIIRRVADKCYRPTNRLLLDLIDRYAGKFSVTFSLTGTVIDQLSAHAPDVLESFKALAATGHVELLCETDNHSLSAVLDWDEFAREVAAHRQRMADVFGAAPTIFRNTELIYSDELARRVEQLGFAGILIDGVPRVLAGRARATSTAPRAPGGSPCCRRTRSCPTTSPSGSRTRPGRNGRSPRRSSPPGSARSKGPKRR